MRKAFAQGVKQEAVMRYLNGEEVSIIAQEMRVSKSSVY